MDRTALAQEIVRLKAAYRQMQTWESPGGRGERPHAASSWTLDGLLYQAETQWADPNDPHSWQTPEEYLASLEERSRKHIRRAFAPKEVRFIEGTDEFEVIEPDTA